MKLVRISAVWCPACIIMRPRIDALLEKYEGIESIEYDFDTDDIEKFNVGSTLPVFIFMNDDQEIGRIVGEKSKDELAKAWEEIVK